MYVQEKVKMATKLLFNLPRQVDNDGLDCRNFSLM